MSTCPTCGKDLTGIVSHEHRLPGRPTTEAPELTGMIGRTLRSLVRRAEDGDIGSLEELHTIRRAVDRATVDAARGLVEGDGTYSWAEIGRWLGISRQAARKRFMRGGPQRGL